MPAKNPRINVVLEEPFYREVQGGGPQKLDNMLSSESDPYRRI